MTKISQLTPIGANLAADDEFIIRDVSDASTPNKKVTASGFFNVATALGFTGLDLIRAGASGESQVQTFASGVLGRIDTTISGVIPARTTISGYFENASGTVGGTLFPVVTQTDIGTDPNQVPLNGFLGTMAFQDSAGVNIDLAAINTAAINTAAISSAAVTAFSNVPLLTGGGLKFPPTQVASADPNTLDDYEEGTWTPSVGGNATYSLQSGFYTKIGRIVYVQFAIEVIILGTGSTTQISGLPFNTSTGNSAGSSHYFGNLASNVVYLVPEINTAFAGKIVFAGLSAAGGGTSHVTIFQNGTRIDGTACYMAA
jgi:hypothetical protein